MSLEGKQLTVAPVASIIIPTPPAWPGSPASATIWSYVLCSTRILVFFVRFRQGCSLVREPPAASESPASAARLPFLFVPALPFGFSGSGAISSPRLGGKVARKKYRVSRGKTYNGEYDCRKLTE